MVDNFVVVVGHISEMDAFLTALHRDDAYTCIGTYLEESNKPLRSFLALVNTDTKTFSTRKSSAPYQRTKTFITVDDFMDLFL